MEQYTRKLLHNTPIKSDIPNDRRLLAKSVNRLRNAINYFQFKNRNTYFLTKILELLSYLLLRHQDCTKGEGAIAHSLPKPNPPKYSLLPTDADVGCQDVLVKGNGEVRLY